MASITKDMIITDILDVHEGVVPILMASGMHCIGCIAASGETLEQAATVHGINADELEAQLNQFLADK